MGALACLYHSYKMILGIWITLNHMTGIDSVVGPMFLYLFAFTI